MKLKNRTILITGGTSGLGLAMAKRFAELGNQVIVVGRNSERLAQTLAENPTFAGYQADVADLTSLETLYQAIKKDFPQLDALLNSAGIMRAINVFDENVSVADLTAEIQTNFIGTVSATKLFLSLLVKNHGTVITISSGLANMSDGAHPIYDATKSAVRFFTETLRAQAGYFNQDIDIYELVPPLVAATNLENTFTADSPYSLSMEDFLTETFNGLSAGTERIDIGHSKNYWIDSNKNRDEFTKTTSENFLKIYFPKADTM